jgi:hypothetical protein
MHGVPGGVVFAPVLLFRVKVFGWILCLAACLGFVVGKDGVQVDGFFVAQLPVFGYGLWYGMG